VPGEHDPHPYHGANRGQLRKRALVGLVAIAVLLAALISSVAARSC
jgi:hypothetical protein